MLYIALAGLSGAVALVYEVVWTREVSLLVGSQIEATATVLAAFFGGLGLGTRLFGSLSDRVDRPLRLYALLEAAAAILAIGSLCVLHSLGRPDWIATGSPVSLRVASASVLIPVALLLGGTIPALLRAAEHSAAGVARTAGRLVGANTAGGVVGVVVAAAAIPSIGLRATTWRAAGVAVLLAVVSWVLAGRMQRGSVEKPSVAHQNYGKRRHERNDHRSETFQNSKDQNRLFVTDGR